MDGSLETSAPTGITVPSYGAGQMQVRDLSPDSVDTLRAALVGGHCWVRRGKNGQLEHVPSYDTLPPPARDVEMHPFWTPAGADAPVQLELFDFTKEDRTSHSPSIIIQSLCGYNYTPEGYQINAALLEECGFVCLRSRRDTTTGQFWEIWYLPGLWAAKRFLREAITDCGSKNPSEQFDAALRFLKENVLFGSLDVSTQRLCIVMD